MIICLTYKCCGVIIATDAIVILRHRLQTNKTQRGGKKTKVGTKNPIVTHINNKTVWAFVLVFCGPPTQKYSVGPMSVRSL